MSTENVNQNAYGYQDDTVKDFPYNFGLNAGAAKLKKFEWIPNGGAAGAEMEALDIVLEIGGKEVSVRQFPIKKVFNKDGAEFTDMNTNDADVKLLWKKAFEEFNAWMVALMKCYTTDEAIQTALKVPIANFKEYVGILKALLPANFTEIPLDIFMEWQWNISESNTRTFLQVPKKSKQGKWICAAVTAQGGPWKAVKVDDPDQNTKDALKYVDGAGNVHPFKRTGWYMLSKYATMQKEGSEEEATEATSTTSGPTNATGTGAVSGTQAW